MNREWMLHPSVVEIVNDFYKENIKTFADVFNVFYPYMSGIEKTKKAVLLPLPTSNSKTTLWFDFYVKQRQKYGDKGYSHFAVIFDFEGGFNRANRLEQLNS